MEIDINYALVYYTANVNVVSMYWRTYGGAIWYDTRKETRKEARLRLKSEVWEDIYDDYPALKGTEFKYTESDYNESNEMPVININDR